jgi:hypothetical protein
MRIKTGLRLAMLMVAVSLLALLFNQAASQVLTGDPWKMLVLVYRHIDADYVDVDGQRKHLTATMPAEDARLMVESFHNLTHRGVVYDYSGQAGELEAHVVFVDRPLTTLTPIAGGYWPSPEDTRPEVDAYAPPGAYDSVLVLWQASHPATDQSIPSGGWGWGMWAFDITYATVFNLSWVWPSGACDGEVFLHEWLHGVTSFYMSLDFLFPEDDLHGAEKKGYSTDEEGCWRPWLRDYMSGLVMENGRRTGLMPDAWRRGSITTHDIQGWRGEYFDNETLTGPPIVVRDDPAVWFAWDQTAPHPLLAADHFSVRWTRRLPLTDGPYTFTLLHDDGARLFLDDQPLINQWSRGGRDSVTVAVPPGQHALRVEYRDSEGVADARFYWQSADVSPRAFFPATFMER